MDEFTGTPGEESNPDPNSGAGPTRRWSPSGEAARGAADPSPGPGPGPGPGRGRWDLGSRCTGPVGDAVRPLVEALGSVGGPEGLDDTSLRDTVTDLVRVRSLLDAATAAFVARWDARCLWADDGSKAAGARLARDVGCNKRSTGRLVHTARSLRTMALVADAWGNGDISTDHVERLSRACTPERAEHFAEVEAHLVSVAQRDEWIVFERAVAMFETASDDAGSDPTDPDDLAKRAKRERAHRNMRPVQVGDRWQVLGSLDKVGGQIFADRWERITQELWEQDMAAARATCGPDASVHEVTEAAKEIRTSAQRSADALVEMARRAGTTPADGQRPKPLITVVVSAGELMGPIRETFNGLVLSRLEIAQLLTEADFERIVFSPTGQPVDVASPQRFFTGAWRRAIEVRDRCCQHPTCDTTAEYCQIDHVVEHSDGGETSVKNGRLLCPQHNRQRPGRRPPPASRRDRPSDGKAGGGPGRDNGDGDGDPDQPA